MDAPVEQPARPAGSLLSRVSSSLGTAGRALGGLFRGASDPSSPADNYHSVPGSAEEDVEAGVSHQPGDAGGPGGSAGGGSSLAAGAGAAEAGAVVAAAAASEDGGEDGGSGLPESLSTKLGKATTLGLIGDSPGAPVCLICLDPLLPEDFEDGEALQLQCKCRGDLAMRHRLCAARWAGVKGDNVCDICKEPITNLPPPIAPESDSDGEAGEGSDGGEDLVYQLPRLEEAGGPDSVFDVVRVVWVSSIICILFFEMDLSSALWTGVVVGVSYSLFMRCAARSQARMAARYHAQQAALHAPPQHVFVGLPPGLVAPAMPGGTPQAHGALLV